MGLENFGKDCEHKEFKANANIFRMPQEEGGEIKSYCCDLKIECAECGKPFVFKGVPFGVVPDHPTMSIDRTELRIPLEPLI
jgi:hypothetical protein